MEKQKNRKTKKHKTKSLSDYFDGHETPQPIQTPQPPPPPTPLPNSDI